MTQTLAIRLDGKKLARLDLFARKRSLSRSAVVRQALEKFLREEKPEQGVGWAEHFERLKREGRKIQGNPEDKIRDLDRNRGR